MNFEQNGMMFHIWFCYQFGHFSLKLSKAVKPWKLILHIKLKGKVTFSFHEITLYINRCKMSKLYDNWNKFQCLSLQAILHFQKVKKDSLVYCFFPFPFFQKSRMYPVSMKYSTPHDWFQNRFTFWQCAFLKDVATRHISS